jgi:hypothetical protein
MVAFLTALGLLLASFAVHVLVWRVRLPRNQSGVLLLIFILVPVFLGTLMGTAGRHHWGPEILGWDWAGILVFQGGATLSYLVVYTGIEEESPSLVIFRALHQNPEQGCARSELALLITEERFMRSRLQSLRSGGFVEPAPGGYRLTRRGRRTARAATILASIFNIRDSA